MSSNVRVPDVSRERVAISFHLGGFTNDGGGAIVKWRFTDGHDELTVFVAQLVFFVINALERSISDKGFVDARDLGPFGPEHPSVTFMDNQPDVQPSDFSDNRDSWVKQWTWTVVDNGVIAEFTFTNDRTQVIAFGSQVAFYLLERLRGLADRAGFVDLREVDAPGSPS